MNDDVKIVVRGVLDRIEDENIDGNEASLIGQALEKLCGGSWNVITYPSCESEIGYTSSYLNWRGKQWVYAEQTTNTSYNANRIISFMKMEFGWAKIKDMTMVQQSAYTKINRKFEGTWRVHVAKLEHGYSWSFHGTVWESDGYTFFIYPIA